MADENDVNATVRLAIEAQFREFFSKFDAFIKDVENKKISISVDLETRELNTKIAAVDENLESLKKELSSIGSAVSSTFDPLRIKLNDLNSSLASTRQEIDQVFQSIAGASVNIDSTAGIDAIRDNFSRLTAEAEARSQEFAEKLRGFTKIEAPPTPPPPAASGGTGTLATPLSSPGSAGGTSGTTIGIDASQLAKSIAQISQEISILSGYINAATQNLTQQAAVIGQAMGSSAQFAQNMSAAANATNNATASAGLHFAKMPADLEKALLTTIHTFVGNFPELVEILNIPSARDLLLDTFKKARADGHDIEESLIRGSTAAAAALSRMGPRYAGAAAAARSIQGGQAPQMSAIGSAMDELNKKLKPVTGRRESETLPGPELLSAAYDKAVRGLSEGSAHAAEIIIGPLQKLQPAVLGTAGDLLSVSRAISPAKDDLRTFDKRVQDAGLALLSISGRLAGMFLGMVGDSNKVMRSNQSLDAASGSYLKTIGDNIGNAAKLREALLYTSDAQKKFAFDTLESAGNVGKSAEEYNSYIQAMRSQGVREIQPDGTSGLINREAKKTLEAYAIAAKAAGMSDEAMARFTAGITTLGGSPKTVISSLGKMSGAAAWAGVDMAVFSDHITGLQESFEGLGVSIEGTIESQARQMRYLEDLGFTSKGAAAHLKEMQQGAKNATVSQLMATLSLLKNTKEGKEAMDLWAKKLKGPGATGKDLTNMEKLEALKRWATGQGGDTFKSIKRTAQDVGGEAFAKKIPGGKAGAYVMGQELAGNTFLSGVGAETERTGGMSKELEAKKPTAGFGPGDLREAMGKGAASAAAAALDDTSNAYKTIREANNLMMDAAVRNALTWEKAAVLSRSIEQLDIAKTLQEWQAKLTEWLGKIFGENPLAVILGTVAVGIAGAGLSVAASLLTAGTTLAGAGAAGGAAAVLGPGMATVGASLVTLGTAIGTASLALGVFALGYTVGTLLYPVMEKLALAIAPDWAVAAWKKLFDKIDSFIPDWFAGSSKGQAESTANTNAQQELTKKRGFEALTSGTSLSDMERKKALIAATIQAGAGAGSGAGGKLQDEKTTIAAIIDKMATTGKKEDFEKFITSLKNAETDQKKREEIIKTTSKDMGVTEKDINQTKKTLASAPPTTPEPPKTTMVPPPAISPTPAPEKLTAAEEANAAMKANLAKLEAAKKELAAAYESTKTPPATEPPGVPTIPGAAVASAANAANMNLQTAQSSAGGATSSKNPILLSFQPNIQIDMDSDDPAAIAKKISDQLVPFIQEAIGKVVRTGNMEKTGGAATSGS